MASSVCLPSCLRLHSDPLQASRKTRTVLSWGGYKDLILIGQCCDSLLYLLSSVVLLGADISVGASTAQEGTLSLRGQYFILRGIIFYLYPFDCSL